MKLETDKTPHSSQSPEIVDCVVELQSKFGKYAIPDAEARQVVDKAMGRKTLSEELRLMREG